MRNFDEIKSELLTNKDVEAEYEAMKPEYQIIRAVIEARKSQNLTQQELAELTGIDRADISKIENGNANPSLNTLRRLAEGLNMNIRIEFVPKSV